MSETSENVVKRWIGQVAAARKEIFKRVLPDKKPLMVPRKGMSPQELSEFMKDHFGDVQKESGRIIKDLDEGTRKGWRSGEHSNSKFF